MCFCLRLCSEGLLEGAEVLRGDRHRQPAHAYITLQCYNIVTITVYFVYHMTVYHIRV